MYKILFILIISLKLYFKVIRELCYNDSVYSLSMDVSDYTIKHLSKSYSHSAMPISTGCQKQDNPTTSGSLSESGWRLAMLFSCPPVPAWEWKLQSTLLSPFLGLKSRRHMIFMVNQEVPSSHGHDLVSSLELNDYPISLLSVPFLCKWKPAPCTSSSLLQSFHSWWIS